MAQNPRMFDPGSLSARFPQAASAAMAAHAQMLTPPQPAQPMQHPHTHTHSHPHQQQQQQQSAAPPDLKTNFYNPYHVKHRRRTTKEQLSLLESTFKTTPKPTSEVRKSLALTLNMTAREVQIWFQNRRAKQKNMMLRASSATATSPGAADCDKLSAGPDASPPAIDTVCSSAILSALLPATAKHTRATSADHAQPPSHAPRRYSDIPVSLLHPETAAAAVATARSMVTAASTTMASATSPAECTPPLSSGPQDSLHQLFAAPPASSSRPMQLLPSAPSQAQSQSHHVQKKQKRAGASDTDRYHTARVHQEAFDGTNKLPLKPDDLSPRSVDEQFSLLDPSNLPTFMMPGASSSAMGAGLGGLGTGLGGAPMAALNIPSQPSMSYGANMGMYWPSLPYGAQQQQQQQQPLQSLSGQTASGLSQNVPQTDMSLLFSGLLGLGSTGTGNAGGPGGNPYPGLSLNTFGLSGMGSSSGGPASAPVNPAMNHTDLSLGSDPAMALYQTLFLLGQRPSQQQQQQQQTGKGSSRGAGLAPTHSVSPLSPPESVAMTSPGVGAGNTGGSSSKNGPAVAASLMSPVQGSAFAPYDARAQQAQAKQQQQPQQQQQQHGAMFMPTSVAYSQLVGASGINDAGILASTDIFASTNTTSPSK
ncbi:hypothetical protein LPJ56_003071 [Coemansia sp. RSA 2599]|nr:hypothetical protein LPJ56_003071 [Coemansia sp. RSA 2599]